MSSMRNAVQRRPHRERAQPLERRRLGLLEKHKDYSLRAQDYNKKKVQLKALRNKAADRNEDEFYFGMMSRKGPGSRIQDGKRWSGTVQGDRGNKVLDMDTARLLKTQDLGYVRTMKQVLSKQVKKLEEQVVLTRGLDRLDEGEGGDDDADDDDDDDDGMPVRVKPKAPRKIVFVDDEEEREDAMELALEQEENDDHKNAEAEDDDDETFERERSHRRLKRQLENSRQKLKTLAEAEIQLQVQQAKMAKTATSGGTTRRGKKIKVRTRKR
ncbi:putative U3 small nucleolar RNA-associated protein 11 [Drechmeria coniospora]|uniref:U3 small nucleolar RNA-associated protein 11 n=1 Tax=Drechmeria coniospora TaxID=98403 RepID=A0A151GJN4_DRECN|nr:putative U3 small nucleolar RNA-associated protein 11 [Drechmeria coniospora]KYK57314.1 putative U3 small nucleolar RNA-associated protein 11 [Drechmeria coniospora]